MLIAHISDFHVFSGAPETALVRADAAAVARKVVADVAAFTPRIDAVCFTGDLTDGGSDEDYVLLKDILSPIQAPVLVVPGNHDKRGALREAFGHCLPFEVGPTLNYEKIIGHVRILALDSVIEGQGEGRLDALQLRWLRERLASHRFPMTLVLVHHPAFASGIRELDEHALIEGGAEFGEIVRSYGGVLRILSGHLHRPYQAIWNGVFAAVAGSPAFQVALDIDPASPEPGPVDEPYAYFIHRLGRDGELAVHTRYVDI